MKTFDRKIANYSHPSLIIFHHTILNNLTEVTRKVTLSLETVTCVRVGKLFSTRLFQEAFLQSYFNPLEMENEND